MRQYKLAEHIIDQNDLNALAEWLRTNPQLTNGNLTLEFEREWARWVGTKYAVFCNSGSSANLLMAYASLLSGKLKNKKVILPSVGWVTTIAPFMQFGFEPIMCGADNDNFGLHLEQLESLLKKHDPAVVIAVQVLGVPMNIDAVQELQKKYGFFFMEDACAALGAEYGGKKVGAFSAMSSFSFFFGHQLSTIEGGMVNTDDEELYHLLLMLRSHGWIKNLPEEKRNALRNRYHMDGWHEPFTFVVPGFNVRATDLQAFLGLRMIKKADAVMQRRTENHLLYAKLLTNVVDYQHWDDKSTPCSISFGALARDSEHRKKIVTALDEHNIETRLFSAGNLGLHPFWTETYGEFHDEVSDKIHACGFFLPNNESIHEEDVKHICSIVNNA
ncbi:MAG: aminotransferase class I/II-fold pyridoxal phosphate-dependent enzyme [Patescibacteria group bacterium]